MMPHRSAIKTAPGIRQLLPLPFGLVTRMRTDLLGFFLEGHRHFGDVFRFQVGPLRFHLLAHPDHVRHVLLDNQANYKRSWAYERPKIAAGEGLVTTDGPVWRRLRRMVQPAFHGDRIEALAGLMTGAAEAMLERWRVLSEKGEPVDIVAEFAALTLRIVGRTLLSVDLGGEADRIGPAIVGALEFVQYQLDCLMPPPFWIPTRRNRRFRRDIGILDSMIYQIIAGRLASGKVTGDLLSMLLEARDVETGEGLTERELRDQLLTFIVAGQETTANSLAWTFHLLGQHPEAAGRLREEIDSVLGDRAPVAADLTRLAYTRSVIEESLRLYPTVYGVARQPLADDEIGGYRIPRRSQVLLSPYVTHRHPDFWPDPETFDPDRFLLERTVGRPRFAWFPFLGGPHQCIGQEFAMMEITLVVVMIFQRFRLSAVPGQVVEAKAMLSLRPREGLPMFIHPI